MAKHIPRRMCVGCRSMKEKCELIRVVVENDELLIDTNQKILKRGFYVCKDIKCIENSEKRKAFQRILKSNDLQEFYEELKNYAKW